MHTTSIFLYDFFYSLKDLCYFLPTSKEFKIQINDCSEMTTKKVQNLGEAFHTEAFCSRQEERASAG